MSSSIKIKDLKNRLGEMDRTELIQLICKLHKNSKEVQQILSAEFCGDKYEAELLEEAKEKISKKFNLRRLSLKDAKKVISDYKKVCKHEENLAELMLHYVECGIQFSDDYGDIYDSFYNSMESVFENFVEIVNKMPVGDYYFSVQSRVDDMIERTRDMGWGFYDDLDDLRLEIKWIDQN